MLRGVSSHRLLPLDGWELAACAPGAAKDPAAAAGLAYSPAQVPGTVASSLRALGHWSLDDRRDFDAEDFWFRCRFAAVPGAEGTRVLRFDGLATLCDAWLNGAHLLRWETMFRGASADVSARLRGDNELYLRFSSLTEALEARRPRPRWKTRLVRQQQLRWVRTTLLGRIPGWTPKAAPVGPVGGVVLEERAGVAVDACDLRCALDGDDGLVTVSLTLRALEDARPAAAELEVGEAREALEVVPRDGAISAHGTLRIPNAPRWWPHTHGAQPLLAARVRAGELSIDLGRIGFRTIAADRAGGGFALRVNGVEIFARGACWTTLDPAALRGHAEAYRATLVRARDAGMNMVRLGGTMAYEDDAFYDLCDELGILVWQDFMFANFDYPAGDAAFAAEARAEADAQLARWQGRPSLAVLCGGSEVEQQAAMMGQPRVNWRGPLFDEILPAAVAARAPEVPWVANSPTGGTLPFSTSEGIAHYYGVGAYLRPLEDARRAGVRFTSECLAFANVPVQSTVDALLGEGEVAPHHPRWKARVPRDTGTSWDFEDVREHYLGLVYRVDPAALRLLDGQRWLDLSRPVTGEVMAATFAEWRRSGSTCKGALVWTLQDLWPGAGWGVIDATGKPKPAYWILRRALLPRALTLTDEGLDGLRLCVHNDAAEPLRGEVQLALYRNGEVPVARGVRTVEAPARGDLSIAGDSLFDGFHDLAYAYRFGPPGHDLAVASLRAEGGRLLAQAFHFPLGQPHERRDDLGLEARVIRAAAGWELRARSRRFAQSIELEVEGAEPDDDWFHLEPGVERSIALRGAAAPPRVRLQPLNAFEGVRAAAEAP